MNQKQDIKDPQTCAVIGAAMRVHNKFGYGFFGEAYRGALELEFQQSKIPYEREKKLPITYDGQKLNIPLVTDFFCYGNMLVILKVMDQLTEHEERQMINYLKATGEHKGLLINFGSIHLEYKRFTL